MTKPKIYFTTPVFKEIVNHPMVSPKIKEKINELWENLEKVAEVKIAKQRFPSPDEMQQNIVEWGANIVGCHLSHQISAALQQNSALFAVSTSTAGFNHIDLQDGILYTHTPGVLDRTVADFTLALILSNLRNIVSLHNYLWSGSWKPGVKWDLDQNLAMSLDNLLLGIVGMGEIGRELVRRIAPWGISIQYYDITRDEALEEKYPNLKFIDSLETLVQTSDVVSLHLPLNEHTKHLFNKDLLLQMKENALLVNTARGGVIDTEALLSLLESGEIRLHLALDVHENEPLKPETLDRFKKIQAAHTDLSFILIPHNASADADTRGEMAIMILSDIYALATAESPKDLESLRLIPQQRELDLKDTEALTEYRIQSWWDAK